MSHNARITSTPNLRREQPYFNPLFRYVCWWDSEKTDAACWAQASHQHIAISSMNWMENPYLLIIRKYGHIAQRCHHHKYISAAPPLSPVASSRMEKALDANVGVVVSHVGVMSHPCHPPVIEMCTTWLMTTTTEQD